MNTFGQTISVSGTYLWSNGGNWSEGVPTDGGTVAVDVATTLFVPGLDDIPTLSLASLVMQNGFIEVVGTLTIGELTLNNPENGSVFGIQSRYDSSNPALLVIENLSGTNGEIDAVGTGAVTEILAPSDPGESYAVNSGGELILGPRPNATSELNLDGGTLALENPGATVAALLEISAGNVLELPGGAEPNVVFGGSSMTIASTTFSNVSGTHATLGYETGLDSATGLEAITFVGSVLTDPHITQGGGAYITSGETVVSPTLAGGATLTLAAGAHISGNITLSGTGNTLIIDPASSYFQAGPIAGFEAGDTIKLAGVPFQPALDSTTVAIAGTVTVDADGSLYHLIIDGATIGQNDFILNGDLGITENTLCFCVGTRIATPDGEVPVEDLRIGDMVRLASGAHAPIQWIGQRSYDGRFIARKHLMLPVCIKAGAIADAVPKRDLWVSPGHAIQVGGVLVAAWRLINGVNIIQPKVVEQVRYFHIELTTHELLLAEGCPAESYLDNGQRNQFHNAGTATACFPAPGLERTERGFALQAIQARLARRAGIRARTGKPGPLRGYIERSMPDMIIGWAQDASAPDTPVCLDVLVNGRRIARLLANHYRADVRATRMGGGCHGFELAMPAGTNGHLEIRHAVTGALLPEARRRDRQIAS